MQLYETLRNDYKTALKDKQEVKKVLLNMILAAIKNKTIELKKEPTDSEIMQIMQKEIKAIKETISFMEKAGKSDDIVIENEKIQILQSYLPAQPTHGEIVTHVGDFMKQHLVQEPAKHMRDIIGSVKEKRGNAVDMKVVQDIIHTRK